MATTNYSIPVFNSTDSIDLIGVYNAAMQLIDTKLKSMETNIGSLNTQLSKVQGFTPNVSTDKPLTVSNLNSAKVTSAGIVYFKQS